MGKLMVMVCESAGLAGGILARIVARVSAAGKAADQQQESQQRHSAFSEDTHKQLLFQNILKFFYSFMPEANSPSMKNFNPMMVVTTSGMPLTR